MGSCEKFNLAHGYQPPTYRDTDSGSRIYYSYFSALEDAQENDKLAIVVFFNPTNKDVFSHLFNTGKTSSALSTDLQSLGNVVVMQRGLISSLEYYPKMDPMTLYMADFCDRFPTLDLSQGPSIILIIIDKNGRDVIAGIRSVKVHN
ncbi:hypothetical protein CP10139811_0543 [Chlamydia ibidis]|uniref:Uncharacterized protein n=1 Tax=Chlamydia ibidis TaxID=1405396 RepID=S7KF89_9CHLA|nr:hypothetical protein CP10139811_0543 [Chlamydia ibidis]